MRRLRLVTSTFLVALILPSFGVAQKTAQTGQRTIKTVQESIPTAPASLINYDLLFRNETLNAIPRNHVLIYQRVVQNRLRPEASSRESGQVVLRFTAEHSGPDSVLLQFEQKEKYRTIGEFPASIGNPIIMYFMETVIKDIAQSLKSSPFYIRNRIKEALVQPANAASVEVTVAGAPAIAQVVTLRPFEKDPNAVKMHGFEGLELTVTMSDAVPGWYLSLEARVPAPDAAGEAGATEKSEKTRVAKEVGAPLYISSLNFEREELEK